MFSKNKINDLEEYNNYLKEENKTLNNKNKLDERNNEILNMSNLNLINALNQPLSNGKRYTYIDNVKARSSSSGEELEQQIVIIFDEVDITYSIEYFEQNVGCDRNDYIKSLNLDCLVFIDGKQFDPIDLSTIYKGTNQIKIHEINCGSYGKRGLGTAVIKSLVDVLDKYDIEELTAPLSPVDNWKKDDLYNFYINKNGFELIKEVTEETWGLAIKKLKKSDRG